MDASDGSCQLPKMEEIFTATSPITTTSSESEYPHIEPTTFDLVVCGTGLPESLLAAAAASAGRSVLHLDPNPFYGSFFSTLSLTSFLSFVSTSTLYTHISTSTSPPPEPSRSFLVELAGPRILYCADEAVDLLLRSGGSHHVEFKSIEGSLIYWNGGLCPVPDSRQAIFRDQTLRPVEKNLMFAFLRLVQSHIQEPEATRISQEELEMPFVEFLKKQRLPPKIRAVVLYAIAMADYDQEDAESESCKKLITTKEGITTIALYSSSIGRFTNAAGAFIYPMYGHGELPQAFCRCAAVKGALYVLRMPVANLLMDENRKEYKGVRLASGQDISCQKLVMDPSYQTTSFDASSDGLNSSYPSTKVARGVCIASMSIKQEFSNTLVVFPPKSLGEMQSAAIRVLQLSSNVAVCPPGMFTTYLSTPCDDPITGKECITAAIDALFTSQTLDGSEGNSETSSESKESVAKPALIWSCVYVQQVTQVSSDPICSCPMPDENVDYKNILEVTRKLFADLYPSEEFLPRSSAPEYADDDNSTFE